MDPQVSKQINKNINNAIERTQDYLFREQYSEGYWWGELESNPTMEAEFLLLHYFLGIRDNKKFTKLSNHIISQQREDGTWGQYYGAPGDLSTSVECYLALKIAGYSENEKSMIKAKDFILSKGGIEKTRVFTKIWLSLVDQWKWEGVPIMPAELILLPNWSPINIYEFSSWARSTIVPLLILMDKKPVRPLPENLRVDELFFDGLDNVDYSVKSPSIQMGWENFFYATDQVLRLLDKLPIKPTRDLALKKSKEWILEHQEADGSWGGIQPPWVYSIMALYAAGYGLDDPVIKKALHGFKAFEIEDQFSLRVQACVSPIWDTGLAIISLLDSGIKADDDRVQKAGQWLINKQIKSEGDWQVKANNVRSGGWAFEFENEHYPDIDDAAVVATALHKIDLTDEYGGLDRKSKSIKRCVQWIEGMQSKNGGWASFDKDNMRSFIARIPFSDFGETIDPPSVDVTAHVLELLGTLDAKKHAKVIAKALDYVLLEQEQDGSWFGRWGVNYIYGIGSVLPALRAIGIDPSHEAMDKATKWLEDHQNEDGGWGETPASYVDPALHGKGPSTASQTAWSLMSLIAADKGSSPHALKGINYLLSNQNEDGSWDEPEFTGTGFPGYGIGMRPGSSDQFNGKQQDIALPAGFMINYHMYRIYWPLCALGRFRAWNANRDSHH
ncbi:MAG: squalene--hopene cyclase [Chloroflexota bacterium]|jgi:squalene-hopene/tetraprenyl-beta-curcumene cyclase|tara:strand:- start:15282 stop:17294 length:2013 start_codon:yes stop_codon:yes gene_type:complete